MIAVAPGPPVPTTEGDDFEAFVSVDAATLTDAELTERFLAAQTMRARLDAATVSLLDCFDARTVWAADGARNAAGWVTARAGISHGQARAETVMARELRGHPHIAAAARTGLLTHAQVRALLKARRPGLEEVFDICEAVLVDEVAAATLAAGHRYLARWVQTTRERLGLNDPDGPEPNGGEGHSRAHLSPVGDRWAGDLDLSAEDGEILATAIDTEIDAMWRAKVFTADDELTAAERRADALVELVRRGTRGGDDDGTAHPLILALATMPALSEPPGATPGAHRAGPGCERDREPPAPEHSNNPDAADETHPTWPASGHGTTGRSGTEASPDAEPTGPDDGAARPTLPPWDLPPDIGNITAAPADDDPLVDLDPLTPYPLMLSELSRVGPVSPATLGRLACEGTVVPIYVGEGADQLNMGRKIRIANRAQRRALRVRDGDCQFPGCAVAPEYCIAHHLTWWEHGGRTDLINLVLLCRHHHGLIHTGAFTMTRSRDGTLTTARTNTTAPLTPSLRARPPLVGPRPPPDPTTTGDPDDTPAERAHTHHLTRRRAEALIANADARRRRARTPSRTATLHR